MQIMGIEVVVNGTDAEETDSTLLHCSWCGVRTRESQGVWFHCEELGRGLQPVLVPECPGSEAWPIRLEVTIGIDW